MVKNFGQNCLMSVAHHEQENSAEVHKVWVATLIQKNKIEATDNFGFVLTDCHKLIVNAINETRNTRVDVLNKTPVRVHLIALLLSTFYFLNN